ncbi:hypothetical protein AB0L40_04065 [Patulibacter sp. NPDC049589]|uniref:hypothetical protein n=1 Tax=Patulibacter sp. NPDC049589 TaxID=3154731 RepID=UPI003422CAEF
MRVLRVLPAWLPPLVLLVAIGWLSIAFEGVDLRYDGSGYGPGCPSLQPATDRALARAGAGPLVLLVVAMVTTAAALGRRRRSATRSRAPGVVLLAAASLGGIAAVLFYAPFRDDSVIWLFWFFLGPGLVLMLGAAALVAERGAALPGTWGATLGAWAACAVFVLLVPYVVGGLTQTTTRPICT